MASKERASVEKMARKKFVVQLVQAVVRRQWPKWGLAHRVILCPTCWPIAIQRTFSINNIIILYLKTYSAPHAGLLQSKAKRKVEKINEKNDLKNYTLV